MLQIRCDLLKSPWRDGSASGGWLDAILCDPPYGIREGSRSFNEYEVPEKLKAGHIPQTKRVRFSDHLVNLLDFAARNLVAHGRLVFWLPTTPDYSDEDVPTHACMKLVSNCEQVLTMRFRRRLLTFEKVGENQPVEQMPPAEGYSTSLPLAEPSLRPMISFAL